MVDIICKICGYAEDIEGMMDHITENHNDEYEKVLNEKILPVIVKTFLQEDSDYPGFDVSDWDEYEEGGIDAVRIALARRAYIEGDEEYFDEKGETIIGQDVIFAELTIKYPMGGEKQMVKCENCKFAYKKRKLQYCPRRSNPARKFIILDGDRVCSLFKKKEPSDEGGSK